MLQPGIELVGVELYRRHGSARRYLERGKKTTEVRVAPVALVLARAESRGHDWSRAAREEFEGSRSHTMT